MANVEAWEPYFRSNLRFFGHQQHTELDVLQKVKVHSDQIDIFLSEWQWQCKSCYAYVLTQFC